MSVSQRSSQVKLLNQALILVGVATIGAALYFAAIDRLLLTAAVCFAGLVPAGALVYTISRLEPRPTGAALYKRQHRIGLAGLTVGAVALIVGGVLTFTTPAGSLATLLLWTGPGMIVGGGVVLGIARAGRNSTV